MGSRDDAVLCVPGYSESPIWPCTVQRRPASGVRKWPRHGYDSRMEDERAMRWTTAPLSRRVLLRRTGAERSRLGVHRLTSAETSAETGREKSV